MMDDFRISLCGVCLFEKPKSAPPKQLPLCGDFRLPIEYLSEHIHTLSPSVAHDLELDAGGDREPMYVHLLRPKNDFARLIMPAWRRFFSTDVEFLSDTQQVLRHTELLKTRTRELETEFCSSFGESKACDRDLDVEFREVMEVWRETKETPGFSDRYSFVDWTVLKPLNESADFLQCMSVVNLASPLIGFLVPVLCLILPFLVLRFRGLAISPSAYIEVLADVAKNHFIGKMLASARSASVENVLYAAALLALYVLQTYQNIEVCRRYYANLRRANTHLVCIRGYFARVAARMCAFAETHGSDKRTYAAFAHDAARHAGVLRAFAADLAHLTPFATTPAKAAEMGFVLHKYWRLHSDPDLDAAARFSFGFMAYSENMAGVYESLAARTTAFARFERGASTVFKEQYYPAHKDDAFVANSLSLRRNVLLSGPNASGKTTLLKSLCLNVIFSQQFGCGFYSSGVLDPYTHIHSYLNIPDSSGRDSLFQAESRRCKDIMDAVHANPKYRHLCIFDELYSGTNPAEATQAGYAFLRYICGFANVDFALTTHYVGICARLRRHPRVALRKMETRRDPVTRKLVYTYRMRHGVSRVLGAADVLEEMEYPKEIVDMVRKGGEAPL